MGFRRQQLVATLAWREGELAGLEVICRPPSGGDLVDAAALAGVDVDAISRRAWRPEDIAVVRQVIDGFGAALVSWNLEDQDGVPVPATVEAFRAQDLHLIFEVLAAWQESAVTARTVQPPGPARDLELEAGLGMRVGA